MSQTDVARRAGVAQSVISAYESGHREPAMSTLAKLVEATGHQLVVEVEPAPNQRLGLPDTPLGRRLRRRRKAILETAAKYGASNVRVFGSVARGEERTDSDVDFLVDLRKGVGLVGLGGLQRELSQLLATSVDVVPADSLKQRMRATAEAEAIPL
jgi:predicted nucleotidyltransferase